jgi:hypothetical protein
MTDFKLHWSKVEALRTAAYTPGGTILLALWPSPVNLDACFEAAGFTDFADNDDAWDDEAGVVLDRLLSRMVSFGEPRLQSEPLTSTVPWYRRLFTRPQPLPLKEQLELPLHWDSLPQCHVAFGSEGAALRTGNGHHLYWITLPGRVAADPEEFLRSVAGPHPLQRTDLDWEQPL